MKIEEFNAQVRRLSETFGAQHYKQERLTLLWREVKDFEAHWLEHVVDGMISSSKYAPLPADFYDAVSAERERRWKTEKEQHSREIKNFMRATFPADDQRSIIQGIIKRITKKMPDDEWGRFQTILRNAANASHPVRCKQCEDHGLIWAKHGTDGYTAIFKCNLCARNDPRQYPTWNPELEGIWDAS